MISASIFQTGSNRPTSFIVILDESNRLMADVLIYSPNTRLPYASVVYDMKSFCSVFSPVACLYRFIYPALYNYNNHQCCSLKAKGSSYGRILNIL